jgi:cell division topological specificity factor
MNLLDTLFNRRDSKTKAGSSSVAKERLQLAILSDRVKISPETMEMIKEEIITVISKHFDIDRNGIEIALGENNTHLIANIPVRRSREFNPRS